MTRIVKFTGRNGDTIGINPEHVAYCAPPMEQGKHPLLGYTAVQLAQPTPRQDGQGNFALLATIVVVKGEVSETIEALNHGETADNRN